LFYDVAIIGAGMSGLAAGIRLAQYDYRVCILDQHQVFGGLNSFYTMAGRPYDVGLHAITNFAPATRRNAPLSKLFRQLRIDRDEWRLCPQIHSEVRFPEARLRFSNDPALLEAEVGERFPAEVDRFRRMVAEFDAYNDTDLTAKYTSARSALAERLKDPLLIEMLLCPVQFYGSPEPHDLDLTGFVTLFKSLYREGFARPVGGVRTIISSLVRRYRGLGGTFRMGTAVTSLETKGDKVTGLRLGDGSEISAGIVLSSAGAVETMALCCAGDGEDAPGAVGSADAGGLPGRDGAADVGGFADGGGPRVGRLTFFESVSVMDRLPAADGYEETIIFYNDADRFRYDVPDGRVDTTSGVVCCPNNYVGVEDDARGARPKGNGMQEGVLRVTSLSRYDAWPERGSEAYVAAKKEAYAQQWDRLGGLMPDLQGEVITTDCFTPRTIEHYTWHRNGAVYGSPDKRRDGRTAWRNLFLCGTDQGFLGIVGALLSGITVANQHVLSPS
jgi:phytoene dehydrogenase-like protein